MTDTEEELEEEFARYDFRFAKVKTDLAVGEFNSDPDSVPPG